jgi:hypothetical protein
VSASSFITMTHAASLGQRHRRGISGVSPPCVSERGASISRQGSEVQGPVMRC